MSVCKWMWGLWLYLSVFESMWVYVSVFECMWMLWVYLSVVWTSTLQLFPEPHTEFCHNCSTSVQTHPPRFRIPVRTVTKIGTWSFPNTPKSVWWWANFGISTSWPSLHTGHQHIYTNSTRRVVCDIVCDIGAKRCKRRDTHHFAHIHATQVE
jgi:hypothetical protein